MSIKIMVMGDSNVGKSNLILRYADDTYTKQHVTTFGVDFKSKTHEINNETIKTDTWEYKSVRYNDPYNRKMQGIDVGVLVFDLTNRCSFDSLDQYINLIKHDAKESTKIILVGNKADAINQRKVDKKDIENFAKHNSFPYIECSAKTGQNVEDVFETAIKHTLNIKVSSLLENKQQELLELIQAISKDKVFWSDKVRFGGVNKIPAGAQSFTLMDNLNDIVKEADRKHSGSLFFLHSVFRGRDKVTNNFYDIIKNLNVNDETSVENTLTTLQNFRDNNTSLSLKN